MGRLWGKKKKKFRKRTLLVDCMHFVHFRYLLFIYNLLQKKNPVVKKLAVRIFGSRLQFWMMFFNSIMMYDSSNTVSVSVI